MELIKIQLNSKIWHEFIKIELNNKMWHGAISNLIYYF